MKKILFVCLGNICRSPAAENIMRHQLDQAGLSNAVECDSAGTLDYHSGKSPDQRMSQTLRNRGVSVAGKARQITLQDLEDFDIILTMDNSNYRDVLALNPESQQLHKVKKFANLCNSPSTEEIPDPYYGGQQGFELVADLLEDGCQQLIGSLQLKTE